MRIFNHPIKESSPEGYNVRGNEEFRFLEFWPVTNTGVANAVFSLRPEQNEKNDANMNLYKKIGLEEGHRDFRSFLRRMKIPLRSVATARLIHVTSDVRKVDRPGELDLFDEAKAPHADALITDNPDVTLFLYAADCALIYLVDPKKRAIGLTHAAWRTALKGVIGDTIEEMTKQYGTSPKDLIAVVSPCLGPERFEVSENIAEQFEMIGMGDFILREPDKKPRLDFYAICSRYIWGAGVPTENIYSMRSFCTFNDGDKFHSFRRGPVVQTTDGCFRHLNGLNGAFLSLA